MRELFFRGDVDMERETEAEEVGGRLGWLERRRGTKRSAEGERGRGGRIGWTEILGSLLKEAGLSQGRDSLLCLAAFSLSKCACARLRRGMRMEGERG